MSQAEVYLQLFLVASTTGAIHGSDAVVVVFDPRLGEQIDRQGTGIRRGAANTW